MIILDLDLILLFIVKMIKRYIYIEVLGSKNNEYLNHKNAIALKAKQYCHEYISIRAFNLNQEYEPFVDKLKKAMTVNFTYDYYFI